MSKYSKLGISRTLTGTGLPELSVFLILLNSITKIRDQYKNDKSLDYGVYWSKLPRDQF